MQDENKPTDSRATSDANRAPVKTRSRIPKIAGIALIAAALFALLPTLKTMISGEDSTKTSRLGEGISATNSGAAAAGAMQAPFAAELKVDDISDTALAYTINVAFAEEISTLNYDAEVVDKKTGTVHTLPSGSCQSGYGDKKVSRVCSTPMNHDIVEGEYSLKVTVNGVKDTSVTVEQDFRKAQ